VVVKKKMRRKKNRKKVRGTLKRTKVIVRS